MQTINIKLTADRIRAATILRDNRPTKDFKSPRASARVLSSF